MYGRHFSVLLDVMGIFVPSAVGLLFEWNIKTDSHLLWLTVEQH
jgi:hypothetical protein